jgi:phage major head subunit gpT-like protein
VRLFDMELGIRGPVLEGMGVTTAGPADGVVFEFGDGKQATFSAGGQFLSGDPDAVETELV